MKTITLAEVLNSCDSIRAIPGKWCQVVAGSNDGFFIEAFGRSFRFASVEDPRTIASYFLTIVAAGPDLAV